MSISIDIVPLSNTLDMYGEARTSSAYSLAGNVVVSMSCPYAFFNRSNSTKILLQSLELTFEGQSESWVPKIGYSATRLCSITRELVPSDAPVFLSNQGSEDDTCRWNVVFNLAIPGWLPASCGFGVFETGVSYHLYATATFLDISDTSKRETSWSFTGIYNSLCSRKRVLDAHKVIELRRFARPPTTYEPEETLSCIMFYISPTSVQSQDTSSSSIPFDILSKVQVLVTVPETIDVQSRTLNFTLRLKTKDLAEEHCKRLQLGGFKVDVVEKDKCRPRPTPEYLSRYPLPGAELQPPNVPLRISRYMPCLYDDMCPVSNSEVSACSRAFSLLPASETGEYKLKQNTYIFAQDADLSESRMWYTLQTQIPIQSNVGQRDEDEIWAGPAVLRASCNGPLLTVRHEAIVKIPFLYDVPGTDMKAHDSFAFSVPLTFVNVAPKLPAPRPSVLMSRKSLAVPSVPSISSGSVPLPVYSQLYHTNGDRKIDSTPLPPYTQSGDNLSPPPLTVRRNSEAFRCMLYHPVEKMNGLGVVDSLSS